MANLYKKPVIVTDPKTGERIKTKSKKWWGRFRDANGCEKRVPLAADKTASHAMLHDILRKIDREKAGLIDPTEEQRKRPLTQHLSDFKWYLTNKGVTIKQTMEATKQVQKMVDARKWKLIGDISASGALDFLGGLRRAGKSAQTYNHYLKSTKQFTRWLVRDRRSVVDPLVHLSKLNVCTDRRHDRRALSTEEFTMLVDGAHKGDAIETIPGPDRAMMYVLAGWTGFRKGEIGSLTRRSFRLDANPPIATVAACYSKRKRQDTQILHPEVVRRLNDWLATKPGLGVDDLLFPVSGRVPGGKERKTHKMMRLDLDAARTKWIGDSETPEEQKRRTESDVLAYQNEDGLYADFHSNRHLFITSLERAGLSPKMAQTLARHSDVRLTLGVYTHVGLHDQTAAIGSLPAPPTIVVGPRNDAVGLKATGTDGPQLPPAPTSTHHREVPTMVPRRAENGAVVLAPETTQIAPNCTDCGETPTNNGGAKSAANPNKTRTTRTEGKQFASRCIAQTDRKRKVSPSGFEPLTFGFGGRRSIQLSYGD